jgi:hypothetical protein
MVEDEYGDVVADDGRAMEDLLRYATGLTDGQDTRRLSLADLPADLRTPCCADCETVTANTAGAYDPCPRCGSQWRADTSY